MGLDLLAAFLISLAANLTTQLLQNKDDALWKSILRISGKKGKKTLLQAYEDATRMALESPSIEPDEQNFRMIIEAFQQGSLFLNYWTAIHEVKEIPLKTFVAWTRSDLNNKISSKNLETWGIEPEAVARSLFAHLNQALARVLPTVATYRALQFDEPASSPEDDQAVGMAEPIPLQEKKIVATTVATPEGEQPAPCLDESDPQLLRRVVGEVRDVLAKPEWQSFLAGLWAEFPDVPAMEPSALDVALEFSRGNFRDKPNYIGLALVKGFPSVTPASKRLKIMKGLFEDGAEILGWLVLLEVRWPPEKRRALRDRKARFEFILPVNTSAGLEIIFSWAFEKAAKWQPGGKSGIEASFGYQDRELIEKGYQPDDPIEYYKRAFCKILNIQYMGNDDLDETFRVRAKFGKHYFMYIDLSETNHPMTIQSLRDRLDREIPNLEVLYFRSGETDDQEVVFRTREQRLCVAIREYFLNRDEVLQKCR